MTNQIPKELRAIIDGEQTDFITKSKRNHPKKKAYGVLFFSLLWNGFVSIFVFAFFGPLFTGDEVHFTSNGTPVTASAEDWGELIFPGIIIGVFLLVGLGMLIWGLRMFFSSGAYFVGTETRFIKYRKGQAEIKDWEQFSGNINMNSKGTYGNLELELRTGKMQSRKNGPSKYVPDMMYLAEIKNVFDIEKKCRIRIKENDPTPAVKTDNYG
ncbi:hypothetical protein ABN763_18770 [Spongiivirga sp. MCCC 1A20706]|uniref:hypothetical protein n=1 Tax=Spongiivirga sp. MCCC 1A20706 TaxID=3160963 RepID=UPI0039776A22